MGSSPNLAELPGWAYELLERSPVGRLGLVDADGAPRVLPVTYAICGVRLVSAVDRKPKRVAGRELARVRWLRARPRAALTVDHYEDDWAELAWVQALGSIHLVDAADAVDELAALSERFPAYRAAPPPGPVLVLEVDRVLWWRAA